MTTHSSPALARAARDARVATLQRRIADLEFDLAVIVEAEKLARTVAAAEERSLRLETGTTTALDVAEARADLARATEKRRKAELEVLRIRAELESLTTEAKENA